MNGSQGRSPSVVKRRGVRPAECGAKMVSSRCASSEVWTDLAPSSRHHFSGTGLFLCISGNGRGLMARPPKNALTKKPGRAIIEVSQPLERTLTWIIRRKDLSPPAAVVYPPEYRGTEIDEKHDVVRCTPTLCVGLCDETHPQDI